MSGGLAGEAFADAVAQEGHDLGLQARVTRQYFAQRILCRALVHIRTGFQFGHGIRCDAAPRCPSLSSARPTCCSIVGDIRKCQHIAADALAHRQHLVQRGAGRGAGHLHHEMAFAEIRHETAAEKRQQHPRGDSQHRQHRYHNTQTVMHGLDQLPLPALHVLNPAGIGVGFACLQQQRS